MYKLVCAEISAPRIPAIRASSGDKGVTSSTSRPFQKRAKVELRGTCNNPQFSGSSHESALFGANDARARRIATRWHRNRKRPNFVSGFRSPTSCRVTVDLSHVRNRRALARDAPFAAALARCLTCRCGLLGRDTCAACGRPYPESDGILEAIGPLTGTNRIAAAFYDGPNWLRFRPWERLFLWFQGPGPDRGGGRSSGTCPNARVSGYRGGNR